MEWWHSKTSKPLRSRRDKMYVMHVDCSGCRGLCDVKVNYDLWCFLLPFFRPTRLHCEFQCKLFFNSWALKDDLAWLLNPYPQPPGKTHARLLRACDFSSSHPFANPQTFVLKTGGSFTSSWLLELKVFRLFFCMLLGGREKKYKNDKTRNFPGHKKHAKLLAREGKARHLAFNVEWGERRRKRPKEGERNLIEIRFF